LLQTGQDSSAVQVSRDLYSTRPNCIIRVRGENCQRLNARRGTGGEVSEEVMYIHSVLLYKLYLDGEDIELNDIQA